LHGDKQGGHLVGQRTLVIIYQRLGYSGLVLGCLQAVLALLAALDQVADAQVGLGRFAEISGRPVARREERQVLPIGNQHRVRTQVGSDLLGLTLLDGGASGQQGVVVLKRKLNGVVQRDLGRALPEHQARHHGEGYARDHEATGLPCTDT
jgi:hypothetical protein